MVTSTATGSARSLSPGDASPQVGRLDTGDVTLSYRDYGGSGTPIVLLHGLASSATIWDAVGPMLARRHRVVALDQRGHGESEKPESGYDFETVTRDFSRFVDALGLHRPVVVGHSWGAHVALEFAARRPGETSGIVLVDGGFYALDDKSWQDIECDMSPPDLSHLTPEGLLAQVREWEWGEFWSGLVEADVLALFDVTPAGTVRPKLSRENHFRILRAVWEQRLPLLYPQVQPPAFLIAALNPGLSRSDERLKRDQVRFASRELSADTRWFRDTYHDIPLQRPEELASEIAEFVASSQDKPLSKPSSDVTPGLPA